MSEIEQLNFLRPDEAQIVATIWDTPSFVYDEAIIREQAQKALAVEAPYGLTVRDAMKTNPNRHILRIMGEAGLAIDAGSGPEAERALMAGVDPEKVLITSQELPKNLKELVERGAEFNACSLHQLGTYGKLFPGSEVGIRINPGKGSGHDNKTNVGGPAASFGVWHEYTDEAKGIAEKYDLKITRLHTHIGSGSDPEIWSDVAKMSLEYAREFPDVTVLNLGGGYKVGRMQEEKEALPDDLSVVSEVVSAKLQQFYEETGRKLHLEIEPGTFLMANAGSLVTTIDDIVDTGKNGYTFLKIDGGMTELLRPALYAAQHPLIVVREGSEGTAEYIVSGHCCESGDMLTPHPEDPELLQVRNMEKARIGDLLVVEGVGAYAMHMSAKNYNSFPAAPEILREIGGTMLQIRRRETLQDMVALETTW
jgi:diaminopimelate decarboxylase